MFYIAVFLGLAVLIGIHELVVRFARRTIRRPWAVLLGPVAGYLVLAGFAFALYGGYGLSDGHHSYIVDEVLPGYDAADKLLPGDRILEAHQVALWPTEVTLMSVIEDSRGESVVLTIERAGERRSVTVLPKQSQLPERAVWLIGIKTRLDEIRLHDTGAALKAAAAYPIRATRDVAVQTYRLIAGSDEAEIGGPVRIIQELSVAARPLGMRALEILLLLGLYAWLALGVLDLVRLVRLARQPGG